MVIFKTNSNLNLEMIPKKAKSLIVLAFLVLSSGMQAQKMGLMECINEAWEKNLQLAQSGIQVDLGKIDYTQSKASFLPSINGNVSHTYNFGRRIDPFTNQFAESRVLSQNGSVSSNWNLFSGLSTINTYKANKSALESAKDAYNQQKNDIALQVSNAFLQAILADELTVVSENQLQISKNQLQRVQSFSEAGRAALNEVLQAEAQVAIDEASVTRNRNASKSAYLTLGQLMGRPNGESLQLQSPNFQENDLKPQLLKTDQVYQSALQWHYGNKSAEENLLSANYLSKASKGRMLPSLGFFAGLGSGFSELSRRQIGSTLVNQYIGEVNGTPLFIDVQSPIFEQTPFRDQMSQNLNRTFGFSLSIPIFNALQSRAAYQRAKVNYDSAKIRLQTTQFQLRREIEQAYLDAQSAYEQYLSSKKSKDAQEALFEVITQRYESGVSNSFEYNQSKSQFDNANSNFLQAKYQLIFRLKVLDFYQGKSLTF
jgi:outer membrane protein